MFTEFLASSGLVLLILFGPFVIISLFHQPWWAYRGRGSNSRRIVSRGATHGNWPSYKHGEAVKTQTLRQLLDRSDEHTIKYWDENEQEFVEEKPE